jgi:hypothetical protein
VVLVHQQLKIGAESTDVLALFDLFITKEYRSREAIASLYGAVETFCKAEGFRFIIGVPNESGARVNIRYLHLGPVRRLSIRVGLAIPRRSRAVIISQPFTTIRRAEAVTLFQKYLPPAGIGLQWTAESLWSRLSGGFAPYGVHATENVMLVSSIRNTRGLPHTLICGFFRKEAVSVSRTDVASITAAACLLHRRPLYLYAGCNDGVRVTGVEVPDAVRPSPLTVQWRDFAQPSIPLGLQRFELLDFDLA